MMKSAEQADAYYLLGFSPQLTGGIDPEMPPLLAQLRIERRSCAGVVAWYRAVPRQEFEGAQGQRNLADLNWITPRVLAHETVVSKLNEQMPFYPSRFGCLFSSIEMLLQFAAFHRNSLQQFFLQAEDRREWGIKLSTDLDRVVTAVASAQAQTHSGSNAGVNYLKMKQLLRTLRQPTLERLAQTCDERIQTLRETVDYVVIRPSRSLAQPDRETLLANVAVWLTPEQTERVFALCEEWNHSSDSLSISVSCTGPWPPYSFCPSLGDVEFGQTAAA